MDNPSSVVKPKEQKQFNKQLAHHIDRYSSLRDWSQLALWLTKLKNMMIDYKGHIIDKTTVLKKLAISLNPSLPAALHESTLQIYEIWFNKFIFIENLQFTCLGLFSYFGSANMKNRIKLVEMFIKYLPQYGRELKMLATGLLITVMPSLIQMHEPLVKEVNRLLEVLGEDSNIGHEALIQSIWIVILKSSSCRISGLKYISSKLGKVQVEQEDSDQDNFWNESSAGKKQTSELDKEPELEERESIQNKRGDVKDYCPHIETLVVNSLLACIEDNNILVTKNALDFLYKYLPLKSQILSDESKMNLCYSIVWLLEKRDMGVTRKINFWIFGKPDSENKFNMTSRSLEFIVNPIIHFLKNNNTIEPLKIIINIFSEHDQMPKLIMQKLIKEIIEFSIKQQSNQQVIKLLQRILDQIYNELSILTGSFGKSLMEALSKEDYRQAENILKLILYLLNKILRPNQIKTTLFSFLKTIMISYQTTNWKNRSFMKYALKATLQIIDTYKDMLKQIYQSKDEEGVLKAHIQLYGCLLDNIKNSENAQNFEDEIIQISKILVKLYDLFGIYSQEWVNYLIENIFLSNPYYYLTPIEVIGEALEKQGKLKEQLMKRALEKKKQNYILISINKLWNILSLGHIQYKVIPLLLRLSKHFLHFFKEILDHDFEVNNEMSIPKFSLFWHMGPKYPTIVNSQQLNQICKHGFFKMLNLLDNGNPLVKYNSKIWINECFPDFHRVLDPLLEVILQPKETWYKTIKGQYIYIAQLNFERILNCIKYLHSIVKHTGNKFFKFATRDISINMHQLVQKFKGKQLLEQKSEKENKQSDSSYFRVIFQIIVRLLSSHFINRDNPGIDLICCQLLQIIIKGMNEPELCLYHIYRNIRDILYSLHFATINNDHILQIQLLNLLDVIFFQSNLRKSSETKKLRNIVSSQEFTKTILEGLNTEFPYIKERFVQFINKSIMLFLQYHVHCGQLISQILNTYISKISYINSSKMQSIGHKDIEISKKNSSMLILFNGVKELLSYFLNLQIKPFEKERNQNQPDAGVFSLYSWKSFVNLKIQKKYVESSKGKRNLEDISKNIPNELDQLVLTMTSCWTISQLFPFYKISLEGLSEFNFEEFHAFNKQLYQMIGKYEIQDSVQTFITNLMRVLVNKYPKQIMKSMIKNWVSANTVELKIKIIQMLSMSSIPLQNFYTILLQSLNFDKLNKKRKSSNLVFEESVENSILHFCQFFTHYNFHNFSVFQGNNLLNIWLAFLKFTRIFENSKNISTLFALIELVDLFMVKHNPKQIARDEKLKKDFQFLEKELNDLVQVCSGKLKVIVHMADSCELTHFLPFPTSVFQVYMIESGKVEDAKVSYMYFNDLNPQKISEYCRVYAFLILKRVSYHFLQAFCSDSEASLVKKARQIISQILPVVEDKSQPNIFIQNASEIILSLLLKRKQTFLKQFKSDVLYIFNKDDFFICSRRTLHCWVQIIDMIIDSNKDHDIFTEYLSKVSLASSIFTSYTLETKKKIKSFERICFILFAGKKDKYNDKTHLLIDKIIQVIKNTEASQPVLILIFFCIRILILRTSPDRLTKLLANVWQLIMFLLTNIFKKEQDSIKEKEKMNLVWAALKLIEMVSIMELNEFHPHQWIFFYDLIGVKFTASDPEPGTQIGSKIKPLISKYLDEKYVPYKGEIEKQKKEGHLIIKEDIIDNIDLLKTKALLLSLYLSKNNQCKMKFEMSEVESLIENDFLNLDEFIFKLQ